MTDADRTGVGTVCHVRPAGELGIHRPASASTSPPFTVSSDSKAKSGTTIAPGMNQHRIAEQARKIHALRGVIAGEWVGPN